MNGSKSVSFGSGLGPGLNLTKKTAKSMPGPGGSGWSGAFSEIISGRERRGRYENVANKPGPTRTTRTHSTISTGYRSLQPGPNPDPHRHDPDRRQHLRHRRLCGRCRRSARIGHHRRLSVAESHRCGSDGRRTRGVGQHGQEHQRAGHRTLPRGHRDRGRRERHDQRRCSARWRGDGGSVSIRPHARLNGTPCR